MEYRVGIDLGGTNVAVGVVDERTNKSLRARLSRLARSGCWMMSSMILDAV